jgi:outer membrane receptor protein involved in Fe transport
VAVTASARVNWTDVALRDQIGTALNGEHTFARVNPAVGVTWQARPAVNLYGSYAQSSRVPTPVELTCADPEDPCRLPNAFVSDPPLDQVVAGTVEAGARGTAGRASWSVAAFRTRSTDDIIFVSSGRLRGEGHFENVEETRRAGVEAMLELRASDRLQGFVAYTGQRAVYGADLVLASPFHPSAEDGEIVAGEGARLPGIPAHNVKFGLSGLLTDRLQAGVTVRAQSGQYLRGDEANLLARLPGFAVVNLDARHRVTDRLAIVGQVHNLLDAEYSTFGVLGEAELLGEEFERQPRFYSPGPRRGAWIGVDVAF